MLFGLGLLLFIIANLVAGLNEPLLRYEEIIAMGVSVTGIILMISSLIIYLSKHMP
jgi:hypothetical protein